MVLEKGGKIRMGKYKCQICQEIVFTDESINDSDFRQNKHRHILTHTKLGLSKGLVSLSFDEDHKHYPDDWYDYITTNSSKFRCKNCGKNNGGEFSVGICESCADELVYS